MKMPNKNQQINLIVIRIYNLFTGLGLPRGRSALSLSLSITKDCFLWSSREGKHGLNRFKVLSNLITRRIMGLTTKAPEIKISRKYSSVMRMARGSYLNRLYWVTILSCYRLVTLKIDYSVGTVVSPFSGQKDKLLKLSRLLKRTCQELKGMFNIKPFSSSFRWAISGKSGPNGAPAYKHSKEDLVAINRENLIPSVVNAWNSFEFSNSEDYSHHFTDQGRHKTAATSEGRKVASRLSFLQDKGGKTRIVAIVDLISQSLLKPVHDQVANILRDIPMDGTFDQDSQRARVKAWSRSGLYLASLDLTACTDRFPAFFQMLVLVYTGFFNLTQGFAWLTLLKERVFFLGKDTPRGVFYSVGQPMGAYSSWPVMALAHHALVQLAYRRVSKSSDNFTDYALLGDDIVIASKEVAESYKELLSYLGMEWSPSKSFEAQGIAEFAKSLYSQGEDLTPFPLALMVLRKNTIISDTLALLDELAKRQFVLSDISVLTSPYKWVGARKIMRLAILSPKSNKSCLPQSYKTGGPDDNTFSNYLMAKNLRTYLHYEKWHQSVNSFVMWSTKYWWYKSKITQDLIGGPVDPLLVLHQIGEDNQSNYPIRTLDYSCAMEYFQVVVGYGWICYNSEAWPNGIDHLRFDALVPGPIWTEGVDDQLFRSALFEIDRLIPGYFEPKCVKHTYKMISD